ncbi:hypothetical protein [Flavobacterium sp.]|uniref:hypothetical protein n=1 Tax=Flavobacterium sp. TaxID=239 RepID=UPI00375296BC
MKKIICLFLFALPFLNFSQEQLTFKSGGRVYNSNSEKLTSDEVRTLLQPNPEALQLFNAGRSKKTVGNIFLWVGTTTFIGKFIYNSTQTKFSTQIVGYGSFGQPIIVTNSKTYSNTLLFIGAGLVIIAIPIKIGFSKKIKKSLDLINNDFKNPKTSFTIDSTNFISNSNGFGISITF